MTNLVTEPINNFLVWQENFNHTQVHSFLVEHDEIPVFFAILYLLLIFWVPDVLKPFPPAKYLSIPMTLWNLTLAIFSILGTFFLVPTTINLVRERGFWFSVCGDPQETHTDKTPGFWLLLFILSKFPEMLDTVFLVVQKKTVIFLHWFHHLTVALYCYHAYCRHIAPGHYFASVNFTAHAFLYTFYFVMSVKSLRQAVKPALFLIKPFITGLQLAQMFFGIFALLAQRKFKHDADRDGTTPCAGYNESNSIMGISMYVSYAVLFGSLFKRLYCSPSADDEEEDGSKGARASRKSASGGAFDNKKADDDGEICNAIGQTLKALHASEVSSSAASPTTTTTTASAVENKKKKEK